MIRTLYRPVFHERGVTRTGILTVLSEALRHESDRVSEGIHAAAPPVGAGVAA